MPTSDKATLRSWLNETMKSHFVACLSRDKNKSLCHNAASAPPLGQSECLLLLYRLQLYPLSSLSSLEIRLIEIPSYGMALAFRHQTPASLDPPPNHSTKAQIFSQVPSNTLFLRGSMIPLGLCSPALQKIINPTSFTAGSFLVEFLLKDIETDMKWSFQDARHYTRPRGYRENMTKPYETLTAMLCHGFCHL